MHVLRIIAVYKYKSFCDKRHIAEIVQEGLIHLIGYSNAQHGLLFIKYYSNKPDDRERWKVGPLYISFDVDTFDSSIISCTGYVEENGLSENQVFLILEKVSNIKEDVYFDVVEVNFEKEGDKERTLEVVKKVLKTVEGN